MPSLPRREAAPEIQPGSLGSAIVTPAPTEVLKKPVAGFLLLYDASYTC